MEFLAGTGGTWPASSVDALSHVVPTDIVAYGKGGSIEWQGFHCFCLPGQMIVGTVPVTFCFTINWTGPDDAVVAIFQSYTSAIADVQGRRGRPCKDRPDFFRCALPPILTLGEQHPGNHQ